MAYRDRNRTEGSFQLNLTPLLDVVLQLITFFMMLIHFGGKIEGESALIQLPTTPAALPADDLGLDRLIVSVDPRGRLIAEGGAMDGPSSASWWADQARKRRAGLATLGDRDSSAMLPTLVVVRADKAATFGAVRGLLTTAQAQGFARFSLIVLRGATH